MTAISQLALAACAHAADATEAAIRAGFRILELTLHTPRVLVRVESFARLIPGTAMPTEMLRCDRAGAANASDDVEARSSTLLGAVR
jgi:2-keto-3-deoxy-6-phosphogluconate aldolase